MRHWLVAACVLVPSMVADAAPCSLTLTDAPRELRNAVRDWVRGEDRCVNLDVHVTPTDDGGFMLRARTQDGRTFRRWVPDAKTAAVLVVSWAADDHEVDAEPEATIDPFAVRSPEVRDPFTVRVPGSAAPSTVMPYTPVDTVATSAPRSFEREVMVGVTVSGGKRDADGNLGFRGALDMFSPGKWRLGASMTVTSVYAEYGDSYSASSDRLFTTAFVAYANRTFGRDGDRVTARVGAGAGVGIVETWLESGTMWGPYTTYAMRPMVELTASASLSLTRRLSLAGGVVANVIEPPESASLARGDAYLYVDQGPVTLAGWLGLGVRL